MTIQERSLKIAQVRLDNGATKELDVEQTCTLLSNTQTSIPSFEIGLRQAQNALSILLGIPPGILPGLEIGTAAIPAAPVDVAVSMPADLLRRWPDIRRAELQAAAQSALIGIAKADLYPQFSLSGSVGLRSSDTGVSDLGELFDGDSLQTGFGPSFQWNIVNYRRIKNAVRVEDARFQQAVVSYRNTVLQGAREVEDGLVALLEISVDAARRSIDLTLIQYRDGAVDYTRVLDTQTSLIAQQDSLTAANGQVIRHLIATYKALGGGWQMGATSGVLSEEVRQDTGSRTDWGGLLRSDTLEHLASGALRKPGW